MCRQPAKALDQPLPAVGSRLRRLPRCAAAECCSCSHAVLHTHHLHRPGEGQPAGRNLCLPVLRRSVSGGHKQRGEACRHAAGQRQPLLQLTVAAAARRHSHEDARGTCQSRGPAVLRAAVRARQAGGQLCHYLCRCAAVDAQRQRALHVCAAAGRLHRPAAAQLQRQPAVQVLQPLLLWAPQQAAGVQHRGRRQEHLPVQRACRWAALQQQGRCQSGQVNWPLGCRGSGSCGCLHAIGQLAGIGERHKLVGCIPRHGTRASLRVIVGAAGGVGHCATWASTHTAGARPREPHVGRPSEQACAPCRLCQPCRP